MTKTWVIADPHFGHWGICKFTQADGVTPLRPWDNPDDMDEALISNWNAVVEPKDRVYILGDLCINRKAVHTVGRCNGRKVLIKGNHDIFQLDDYIPYFDDIRACQVMKGPEGKVILTHIPIHPESLGRYGVNIHGHLHSNRIMKWDGNVGQNEIDDRYICVSVEHTNFTPLDLNTIVGPVKTY